MGVNKPSPSKLLQRSLVTANVNKLIKLSPSLLQLATEYNSFLYFMQDANNYVNSLTPQMLENLEKSVSVSLTRV